MTPHEEIDALLNVDPSCCIPERIVPGRISRTETAEHMARYGLAARRVRGRTLDLGSGVGYGSAIVATEQSVDLLVAFDISTRALAFGKSSYGETISFVTGDAGALPFSDDSLDSIICLEAIEHVPVPGRVLREVARVLRPGGLLVISTPNKWATSPLSRRPINPHHLREWYPGRFKELVSRHFDIEEMLGQSWQPVGSIWRAIRTNVKTRMKAVLRHLRLLGMAQRLWPGGRGGVAFQVSREDSAKDLPSREEVLAAWPRSWTNTKTQGIPLTVILIARPRLGRFAQIGD